MRQKIPKFDDRDSILQHVTPEEAEEFEIDVILDAGHGALRVCACIDLWADFFLLLLFFGALFTTLFFLIIGL